MLQVINLHYVGYKKAFLPFKAREAKPSEGGKEVALARS